MRPSTTLQAVTRRIAGVVFSVLLMQLNLGPREVECTKHAKHGAEAVDLASPDVAPTAGHQNHQPADDRTPCDTPDTGACCDSLGSCSTTVAIRSSVSAPNVAPAYYSVDAFGATAPAYLIRAPELPPPKA